MTVLLDSFSFDDEANEAIVFDAALTPVNGPQTTIVLQGNIADTREGADTILAFGNFLAQVPDIPDFEVPPAVKVIGLYLTDQLIALPVDTDLALGEIVTRGGNDVVIGAVQLLNPDSIPDSEAFGYGANFNGGDLFTGSGDDVVAGLASTLNATAVGIHRADISLEDDNDIAVGAAYATVDDFTLQDLKVTGMNGAVINGGSGRDVVVGAAVQVSVSGTSSKASGVILSDITFDSQDTEGDVVLGIALNIVEPGGEETQSGLVGQEGLSGGTIVSGLGDDVVIGVIGYTGVLDMNHSNSTGIAFRNGIELAGGENTVVGVVFATTDGAGRFVFTRGITSDVITGDGDDFITGISIAAAGDTMNAVENGGIGSFSGSGIETFGGADTIIGIVDISVGTVDGSVFENNVGIATEYIETGDQNDVVIGLSMPLSGALYTPGEDVSGNYGITGVTFVPDSDIIIPESVGYIDLGADDDFVFARGVNGGIFGVAIFGDGGNDVFDIQSGMGEIDGGNDIDTLILAGDGFVINLIPTEDQGVSSDFVGAVEITRGDDTALLVTNVEFIVANGETIVTEDLVLI